MSEHQKKLQLSVKKAQGTLEKVGKLIEDEAYCADIAHQVNAVMGLLQSLNRELLKHHLSTCGSRKLAKDYPERDEFIEELVRTWDVATRK